MNNVFLREKNSLGLDNHASFVEYIRWMRSPTLEDNHDNDTKAILLQKAVGKYRNYQQYFQVRNDATELIADRTFEVKCTWRVRVGGMIGPEDMLLPAFDAAGMPYIPASSLRGVARAWGLGETSEAEVESCLGSLDAPEEHQAGKVIFLDAYPLGKTWGQQEGGLAIDIANSIWKWEQSEQTYAPNPNLFLSLKKTTFLVGLRRTMRCDDRTFDLVKSWLIQGLQGGIGSQVNSGYGEMQIKGYTPPKPFLQVSFTLTGQLIHSYQHLTWDRQRQRYNREREAEVRSPALKSMLRYWFRALALGVLDCKEVRDRLEQELFGAIEPQKQGAIKCRVEEVKSPNPRRQEQNDRQCLSQQGRLQLSFSEGIATEKEDAVRELFCNLTWLAFHLGGVGQGARRPKYKRNSKPYYRGCQLRATLVRSQEWDWPDLPDALPQFKVLFREKLQGFYHALALLSGRSLSPNNPRSATGRFREFVGNDCRIVVCRGDRDFDPTDEDKPLALRILHRLADRGNHTFYRELCGDANSNPSPVLIADLGPYQVVTVFGASANRRREYLRELKDNADHYLQLWPFNGP